MMEKNKKIILLTMLVCFLFIGKVSAEERGTCTAKDLNVLNTEASGIKVTYIPNEVESGSLDPELEGDKTLESVLDMKVYNVTDKFILKFEYSGTNIVSGSFYRDYTNIGSDGTITIRQKNLGTVINYSIKVISNYGTCSGKNIRTIRVTLPKFNYYSLLGACEGIQDYYMCQPYITSDFDGATFFDKVEKYKAKLLDNSNIEVEDDNNSVVSEALTGVKDHKYVVVGVIVAVGVVATVLVLKGKKSES